MAKKKFDQEEWHKEKYDDATIEYYSADEQQILLPKIQKAIVDSINLTSELRPESPIRGVIVYGSWVRGKAHRLPEKSDLDFYTICQRKPSWKQVEFFKERLYGQLYKNNVRAIGALECNGDVKYTDKNQVRNVKLGRDILLGEDFIVVSPNSELIKLFTPKRHRIF